MVDFPLGQQKKKHGIKKGKISANINYFFMKFLSGDKYRSEGTRALIKFGGG